MMGMGMGAMTSARIFEGSLQLDLIGILCHDGSFSFGLGEDLNIG